METELWRRARVELSILRHRMVELVRIVLEPNVNVSIVTMVVAAKGESRATLLMHVRLCMTDALRCHRLKKECQPSVGARKRNGKRSTTSKTAQLEEKLDGLVSLLKATQSASIGVHLNSAAGLDFRDDNGARGNHITSFNDRVAESPNDMPRGRLPNTILPTPGTSDPGSTSHQSPNSDTSHSIEPSPHEAEEYLDIFRTQKSKHFPFIYIPSTTSAQQVFQERPFLWLCIMAMSSKSLSQQLALSNKIRNILAQQMLLENEKDLDLLLGLLAYIGWYVIVKF